MGDVMNVLFEMAPIKPIRQGTVRGIPSKMLLNVFNVFATLLLHLHMMSTHYIKKTFKES